MARPNPRVTVRRWTTTSSGSISIFSRRARRRRAIKIVDATATWSMSGSGPRMAPAWLASRTSAFERHRAGAREQVEVFGNHLELERLELGADRITNLADRARAVDEVDDLVGHIVAVR